MSCGYHVFCLTCEQECKLEGNHADALMRRLIRHAEAIAALDALMDDQEGSDGIDLATAYGHVDPSWFAAHRVAQGHELVVRDEYGKIQDRCGERYLCGECLAPHYCRRQKKHEGQHADREQEQRAGPDGLWPFSEGG